MASVLGMGGMGKTTLALAVAHAVLQRGMFTGVLFLDLHGYDETSLDAGQALDMVLNALGTDPEWIPPEADQRAALYRTQLTARTRAGERILVLADNTSTADQVQHLVPADGPHRLLVTSRDDFATALGARLVDLDVLGPEESVALMDTALRTVLPKDQRIAADPDGTARIAQLCGHLPLALQIAAAQLAADRSLTPGRLADDLEDLGERLGVLEDGLRAVRTVLERSYRRLAPPQAELFRLLAVNPGPDLSTNTAAAVTGITKLKDVRTRLVALSRASLIRQDPGTGRWRMHDLVRAYATEQAWLSPQHSAKALTRLLDHYTLTAQDAIAHVNPAIIDSGRGQQFAGRAEALVWLDAESANLIAAVHTAHTAGHDDITHALASYLGPYLNLRRWFESYLDVAEISLTAARNSNNTIEEAAAWNNLGTALRELRRFDEALDAHRTALAHYQDLGDRYSEATAWNNLGTALRELRRFDEALDAHRTALAHYQDLGDRYSEATAWNNLGTALRELRRFDEALDAHRTALAHYQDLGDRYSEATAWNNLGTALRELRRFDEALDAHRTALAHYQDLGDRYSEATAWNNLGTALRELRRFDEALDAHRTALAHYQDLGDRYSEATAWNNLGTALRGAEAYEQAVEAGERAVAVFRELNDAYREGETLGKLADTLLAAGRPTSKIRTTREASAQAYQRAGATEEAVKALEELESQPLEPGKRHPQ
ncbi:tetratricopeptide repeat protein [Kitasatospora sp. NE20-6]|uniref:tetratricopeptide repeat protein n=1 Tax=Kitasatospora sp. NE20-6 TaxID=2859066 RepID=UPI0038B3F98D